MNNYQRTKEIIEIVVLGASAVVSMAEVCRKVAPDVKKIFKPLFDACKKLTTEIKSSKTLENKSDTNNRGVLELDLGAK